jgi:cation diffusion facilitator CzcD-associated flavoprotein CzcO
MSRPRHPDSYYDDIKRKFAEERDLRLSYRPEGTQQFTSEFDGELAKYGVDPYSGPVEPREAINDTVEVLFIGGGFSALLTSARLREKGVESIRIVERGADVGGTWYWNRYPGAACDVVSYDYLPLLDETGYVPKHHYSRAPEIFAYCQMIAKRYNLYDLAVFQTTVTSTVWNEGEQMWHIDTDRGDHMRARFVICANGTLSKPKLSRIAGMDTFQGHSFHTSRWDYEYTGANLEKLKDKVVGIIGTGATAVQAVPGLGENAKELYVFQRTPSSIDVRDDWPTDQEWAAKLKPGWQAKRRARALADPQLTDEQKARFAAETREEKIRRQERGNIDYMMRIHGRIDETVEDTATADALKPWYMFMCKRRASTTTTCRRSTARTCTSSTPRQGHHARSTERAPCSTARYELDLLIYATGFEVQKTGIYNRIVGQGGVDLKTSTATGSARCSASTRTGSRTCSSWAATRLVSSSTSPTCCRRRATTSRRASTTCALTDLTDDRPTSDAEEWWVNGVIIASRQDRRNQECTPGYYNFEGESQRRQDGNYNGGFKQYFEHQGAVRARMRENFAFG